MGVRLWEVDGLPLCAHSLRLSSPVHWQPAGSRRDCACRLSQPVQASPMASPVAHLSCPHARKCIFMELLFIVVEEF
jgi:hypothetical protein